MFGVELVNLQSQECSFEQQFARIGLSDTTLAARSSDVSVSSNVRATLIRLVRTCRAHVQTDGGSVSAKERILRSGAYSVSLDTVLKPCTKVAVHGRGPSAC